LITVYESGNYFNSQDCLIAGYWEIYCLLDYVIKENLLSAGTILLFASEQFLPKVALDIGLQLKIKYKENGC